MLVKRNPPCSLKPLPLFQGLGPKWDCWALLQFGMGIFWSGTVWIWKVNFWTPSNQGSPIQAFTMLDYDISHPHIQRFWWWWPNNDDDDAFVRVHLHPFTNYDEDDDYNDDDDHVDDDNDYDDDGVSVTTVQPLSINLFTDGTSTSDIAYCLLLHRVGNPS